MTSSVNPEPTLVLFKSNACHHCKRLSNRWGSIKSEIKKTFPDLKFYTLTARDNSGAFNENEAPTGLRFYSKWFPMILLVPGPLWKEALDNLGPNSSVELKDGVQIMNGQVKDGSINYVSEYNIQQPANFVKWLQKAHANPDFKRVQSSSPTDQPSAGPIPSATSSILRPIGPSARSFKRNKKKIVQGSHGNVCSMKIISRPR